MKNRKICRDCQFYKFYNGPVPTSERCTWKTREIDTLNLVTGIKEVKIDRILYCPNERTGVKWYEFTKCGAKGRYFKAKDMK